MDTTATPKRTTRPKLPDPAAATRIIPLPDIDPGELDETVRDELTKAIKWEQRRIDTMNFIAKETGSIPPAVYETRVVFTRPPSQGKSAEPISYKLVFSKKSGLTVTRLTPGQPDEPIPLKYSRPIEPAPAPEPETQPPPEQHQTPKPLPESCPTQTQEPIPPPMERKRYIGTKSSDPRTDDVLPSLSIGGHLMKKYGFRVGQRILVRMEYKKVTLTIEDPVPESVLQEQENKITARRNIMKNIYRKLWGVNEPDQ